MSLARCAAMLAALMVVPVAFAAEPEVAPPHQSFTIESELLHETRRINVYVPPSDMEQGGDAGGRYPVLYMPDGGIAEDFPHVAGAIDAAVRARRMTPVILVGIENTQRRRDMTGPTEVAGDREIAPVVGGSAAFRAFIADELMPLIQARYPGNGQRGIIGESLAGLFILETFFTSPGLFDTWIALDPSLWWNDGRLADSAQSWLASHPEVHGRLHLAWSEPEVIGPRARALAAALEAAAPAGLQWQAIERPDLDHATIYRTLAPEVLPALYTDEREAFDLRVPHQPAPVTVEDHALLFYELHMTNFSRQPLAPVSIDVLDAGAGATVARYAGQELADRLAPVAAGHGDAGVIAPGAVGVMYVELALDPDAMPSELRHRVGYRVEDDIGIRTMVAGGKVWIDPDPPVVIGPPLRGGPWGAVFSPHWELGHRRVIYAVDGRATVPGRFAIDFVKLDAAGRIAADDADLIRNAHGYGEPVLAVADATVVAVRNDYPEAERVSRNGRHPLSKGSGNYIMLEMDGGQYALYEHLRPGSVGVVPGQRVARGDVIGEIGLSGSGAWPHLHFHVADEASLLDAEGLPFVFEHFVLRGRYGDIADLGARRWTDIEATSRYAERPGYNTVVEFPEE